MDVGQWKFCRWLCLAGNHSWPPSWVGAQFQTDVISGSITPEGASRQNLSLRIGTNWQQVVPVPGIIALVVPQSHEGFFMRDQK